MGLSDNETYMQFVVLIFKRILHFVFIHLFQDNPIFFIIKLILFIQQYVIV